MTDNFHRYWYISGGKKKKKGETCNEDSFHSDREVLFLWHLGTSQEKNFLQYDASCGAVRHEAIWEVDWTEECHMRKHYTIENVQKGKTAVVMNY